MRSECSLFRLWVAALLPLRIPVPAGLHWLTICVFLMAACAQTGAEQMTYGRAIPPTATVPTPSVPAPIPTATAEPVVATPTAVPYPTPDLTGLPYEVLVQEVVRGDPDIPAVALTLDGGAIAAYTSDMLATLRAHDVRITIFITGQFAERHPELVLEMIGDGHEIGNHSYAHPEFTKLNDDSIRAELSRTDEIIKDVTGASTKPWFRFPYGARNHHVRRVVARAGYQSIYWTIDTIDWREDATPALVKQRIHDRLQNGAIILAHLGSIHTKEALSDILIELKEQGYRIVTVTELLYPPPTEPTPVVIPTPTIVVEPTPTVVLSSP